MDLLLASEALFVAAGLCALLAGRSGRWSTALGAGGAAAGGVLGLVPALPVFLGGPSRSLRLPWQVPYGSFSIELDALSALFLVPILALTVLCAIYGASYLRRFAEKRSLGPPWFFFNLLAASMVLVVLARNGVLFLAAWEVMAVSSFFLVTFEDEKESVREAGWNYLVASHLGTAFLLVLFISLGRSSGSLDFEGFVLLGGPHSPQADLCFLLALVGFGTKAGFMPFHVWLPEAHPAAPSHVSALMSGVMIKTGLYGLLRTWTFLGPPAAWWGLVLLGLGLCSGFLGLVFALAQRDLKRVLAYSSVENVGIVGAAFGLGLLGLASGSSTLAVLGLGGGLFHILNHSLAKGLLFLGAGAVAHGAHTLEMERLGGLQKRMPWTGLSFLVGAAALSALPPLNCFSSEFLIYLGAFHGAAAMGAGAALPSLALIAGLALIGGLAAACFTRCFGIVFLGEPRAEDAARAREAGAALRLPLLVLAVGCSVLGFLAPLFLRILEPALCAASGLSAEVVGAELAAAAAPLRGVVAASGGLLLVLLALAWLRRFLLSGRTVERTVTWDCGYARPAPRMQYTASSFAQPLTDLFRHFLRARLDLSPPVGPFPREASLSTSAPDLCQEAIYRPAFRVMVWGSRKLRWLQHGQVHLYVLYIAVTLLVLLIWKLE